MHDLVLMDFSQGGWEEGWPGLGLVIRRQTHVERTLSSGERIIQVQRKHTLLGEKDRGKEIQKKACVFVLAAYTIYNEDRIPYRPGKTLGPIYGL